MKGKNKGGAGIFCTMIFLAEHLTKAEEIELQGSKDWTAGIRDTHLVLFVSVEAVVQTL